MKKKLMSILLCLVMAVGLLPTTALAAVVRDEEGLISYEPAEQGVYSNGGYTIDKISHPTLGAGEVDGILTGDDQDRSNSYSWSMADGGDDSDYIYIGTCYNSTYYIYHNNVQTALNALKSEGKLPESADTKTMAAEIVSVMFGVDTFDETGMNDWDPVIISVNKKTGEAKVVFRERDVWADNPTIFPGYSAQLPTKNYLSGYRMVCEFGGKLYFAGMGNPTATLVEVDPATNEARIAYYNIRYTRGVSNGVHGLMVYDGEILMCLATDNYDGNKTPGGIIVASSDPSADLSSWRVIADQDDFDGLPAVMQVDGLNGGGIWDIIEYNGYLYVTVVTDKSIDGKINKQGFAMYRGEKDANGNFSWTQVVGENGTSGYGYGLGIDYSMSCNMWVYNGYLYLGTYNDPMLDLAEVPASGNFELLYNDLDHSIYLYRMNENEQFEQVGGKDDNPNFPNGPIGNLGTGLGNNSNQYVWRMGVHNGEFYIGTYDTSTLTYNFTQITDGTVANMEYEDISGRADMLRAALDQVLGDQDSKVLKWFLDKTVFNDYTMKLYQKLAGFATDMSADKNPVPDYRQMITDYEAFKESVYGVLDGLMSESKQAFLADYPQPDKPVVLSADSASAQADMYGLADLLKKNLKKMVDSIFEVYDKIVYDETIHNFVYYFGCNYYAQKSERGFDLLVSNDGVNFDAITRDGLGDGANHGLRCIASTSQGVFLGTANPYYGTQLWLMHSDADQQPDETPEAPVATDLPERYVVRCTTEGGGHESASVDQIAGTAVIGEVVKTDDGYVCPVTVSTAPYAAAYAEMTGKEHTASAESITFLMSWDGEKWAAPIATDLPTIDVTCTAGGDSGDSGNTGGDSGNTGGDSGNTGGDSGSTGGDSGSTGGSTGNTGIGNVYPVEILDSANGTVTASHKTASAGTVVTIKTAPAQNYALSKLSVRDSGGRELALTNKGSGVYTFVMPASKATVKTTFQTKNSSFTDVPGGSYYEDAVNWAVDKGITAGTSDTTFDPDGICTRAQAVTFLWRAAGSPAPAGNATPFTDVESGSYYAQAVAWAVENGVTKGTSDTTFSPDEQCSRAQIVTFLWRAQKSPAADTVNPFADVSADAYYSAAVLWAVREGVTSGTTAATFSPDDNCTRAQIVTFIYRCMQ